MAVVPLAVATPAPTGAATTACRITGYSPASVTVGLTPVPVTFRPTISGCTPAGWSVEGGNYGFYVHDVDPPTGGSAQPPRERAGT